MKVEQLSLTDASWHDVVPNIELEASLLLLFISPTFKGKEELIKSLRKKFSNATIMGCSTAGEISDVKVNDNTVSLTLVQLEKTTHNLEMVKVNSMDESFCVSALERALRLYGTPEIFSTPIRVHNSRAKRLQTC